MPKAIVGVWSCLFQSRKVDAEWTSRVASLCGCHSFEVSLLNGFNTGEMFERVFIDLSNMAPVQVPPNIQHEWIPHVPGFMKAQ